MELRDALQRALDTLDPADRLLLRLRFEDGLSVPLVAKALGVASPFPLYRRLEKLLGALREALERAGVHDASP
jgi:DNA-directed RNA polymerase specialized sigma24 family protein